MIATGAHGISGTMRKYIATDGLAVLQHAIHDHFRRICHCASNNLFLELGYQMMDSNDYIPADVVVIGRAQNIICGCSKASYSMTVPVRSGALS